MTCKSLEGGRGEGMEKKEFRKKAFLVLTIQQAKTWKWREREEREERE
jgi:hypothetical protein